MKNDRGHLYFIHSKDQSAVKVGFAASVSGRLPSLQSGNPAQLTIGSMIPIEAEAEREFHQYMKPHRIAREWYPDDTLLFGLAWALTDEWCDKVEDRHDDAFGWPTTADPRSNEAGVYLAARDMRLFLPRFMAEFFEIDPDEPDAELPVNHWVSSTRSARNRRAAALGLDRRW